MKEILDNEFSETEVKKPITLRLFHNMEFICIAFILIGVLEKIEHTQFISGVSLLYWGLLSWAALSLFIPFRYEMAYQSKPINYFFSALFGLVLSINLLGKLEKIERTQFIPGVEFLYWTSFGVITLALITPIFHEIKRNAPTHFVIISIILGIISSLKFIVIYHKIQGMKEFLGDFMNYISLIQIIVALLIIAFAVYKKSFDRKYRYHYIRFFLLTFIGF